MKIILCLKNKDEIHKKFTVDVIGIIIIICILCACHKKAKITIQFNADTYPDTIQELLVQNGDYNDALERCESRLVREKMNGTEDSIAAAEAYKMMGSIYATYL